MAEIGEVNSNGAKLEWLCDDRIAAFCLENTSPAVVDAWYETSREVIQNWPETRPYLILERFTNLGLTPYNRQRAEELATIIPDHMNGRVAVVISRGVLGYGIRMFGANRLKALIPNITFEFFFEEAKALEWLEEAL